MAAAMVTVNIANRTYRKSRTQAEKLIEQAARQVKTGIAAVEKNGRLFIILERASRTQAKRLRREYEKAGFKVYACGL